MTKLALLLLVLAAIACAQTATPDPQYFVAAGMGFNHYEIPQVKGWASFGAKIADKTFSLSTLDMTSKNAMMRTGVLRNVYTGNGLTLGILADIGVVTGDSNVGAAFTGGGTLSYDLAKISKVPGAFAVGAVRVVQAAGLGVSPTFSFGVGIAF